MSAALRITNDLVLHPYVLNCLSWVSEMITIYNDVFVPLLGEKASCLGQPFSQPWAEARREVGPIAERAQAGQSTFIRNHDLQFGRGNGPEICWLTFCCSPVNDERGALSGFVHTVIETTSEWVIARQSRILNANCVTGA